MAETAGARDDAAALADLHHVAAGQGPDRRPAAQGAARHAGPVPPSAGSRRSRTQAFYQLSRRRPEARQAASCARALERQLPAGYDIDTHFTPAYDPWDQRLCVVPDGDLFKAISDGTRLGRHRPHRHVHRERASGSSPAPSSRPTSSSPPPGSSCSSSAASSCRSTARRSTCRASSPTRA